MPPRSGSGLKKVGIARPKRDQVLGNVVRRLFIYVVSADSHRPVFDCEEQPRCSHFNLKVKITLQGFKE